MKRIFGLVMGIAMVLFMVGCGKNEQAGKRTLYLYSWADYLAEDLVKAFEKEYNCRIVYDTFDSNEALIAKLQAGAKGYDVIIPSHYVVDMLAQNGRLEKLDDSKLECRKHLDPAVTGMMEKSILEYSVPYMMSYTGIGYNKKVIKDFVPSWTMFERADLKKRATLLDDKREVIGAALATEGLDPNSCDSADLAKAKARVAKWIKNVSKLENEQYKNGIASSEFHLVMGYSGDLYQVIDEKPEIAFVVPKEGALMCCDVLAIPKGAKNMDLAYAFINFVHRPENAATNIKEIFYLCPNKDAYTLLPEEILKNPAVFVDPEVLKKCAFTKDLGEKEAALNKVWSDIKTMQ